MRKIMHSRVSTKFLALPVVGRDRTTASTDSVVTLPSRLPQEQEEASPKREIMHTLFLAPSAVRRDRTDRAAPAARVSSSNQRVLYRPGDGQEWGEKGLVVFENRLNIHDQLGCAVRRQGGKQL